jgi:hypothetical protein
MKYLAIGTLALVFTGAARAQFPGMPSANAFAPNMYNRGTQPLSPYLNMLRGGNPAVNYFYGVQPGTQSNAFMGIFGGAGSQRLTFFPGADYLTDILEEPRDATKVQPTGHPAAFNNTLSYFGTTAGQFYARGGQTQQGTRRGR